MDNEAKVEHYKMMFKEAKNKFDYYFGINLKWHQKIILFVRHYSLNKRAKKFDKLMKKYIDKQYHCYFKRFR